MGKRIVIIGAGSTNFGLKIIGDFYKSQILKGSTIVLHDIRPEAVEKTRKIAENYNLKKFVIDPNNHNLIDYSWPGNVRELRNLIERIAILSNNDKNKIKTIIKESIKQGDIETFKINNLSVPLKEARENFEKEYLTTQLKKFGGNISKTAKFVGMERSALHRKLKGLGVKDLN